MTTNQQLTGAEMADQIAVENKIHIQALHNPDPDFFDDSDEIKNMLELIEYYLTFQCKNFGAIYADFEDSTVLVNLIHSIMSDETTSWDEDRIDIIGLNGNTGDHYIK